MWVLARLAFSCRYQPEVKASPQRKLQAPKLRDSPLPTRPNISLTPSSRQKDRSGLSRERTTLAKKSCIIGCASIFSKGGRKPLLGLNTISLGTACASRFFRKRLLSAPWHFSSQPIENAIRTVEGSRKG